MDNTLVENNRTFHPATMDELKDEAAKAGKMVLTELNRACKNCGKTYGQDLTNFTMTVSNHKRPGTLVFGLGDMDLCQDCIQYFSQKFLEGWSKIVFATQEMRIKPDGDDDGKWIESTLVHLFRDEEDSPKRIET